jgi:hypothetical protein
MVLTRTTRPSAGMLTHVRKALQCSHEDVVASASSYYQWQVPGKAVAVSLSLDVVERLGLAARESGESPLPRRPEIGGFLLGTVKRTRGETTVQVDGFEPVECEHAFGPSYFLSGADQQRLAAQRRGRKPAGTSIVGFFRSSTRKEFALTIEDLDLMATYFSKPSMVMLLVHSAPGGALKGGFFLWEQRAIRTMTPYLPFPFDAAALVDSSYEIRRRPSESAAEKKQAVVERKEFPVGVQLIPLREGSMTRARTWQVPAQLRPLTLGKFRLEWLVATAALAIAVLGGVLHRGTGSADASAILRTQSRSSATAALHQDDRPRPFAVAQTPMPVQPPWEVENIPMLPVEIPPAPPKAPPEAETPTMQTASRIAVVRAAPEVAEAAPAPSLLAAPDVPVELPESPEPLVKEIGALPIGTLPSVLPDVPDPFVTIAVEPLANDRRGLAGRFLSRRNAHQKTEFVPPRLVGQRAPEVTPELRRQIQDKTVPITVKLYVGRGGTVDYAELLSNGTGANRDLATLAVFASRKFQFAPAQEGGEAVPAEVLVRFRFGALANR